MQATSAIAKGEYLTVEEKTDPLALANCKGISDQGFCIRVIDMMSRAKTDLTYARSQ